MRTQRRNLFIGSSIAIAILAALAWILLPAQKEPVFEGKTLTALLAQYGSGQLWNDQTDRALQSFGTDAIPTLLRMLRARDYAVQLKFMDLLRTLHLSRGPRVLAADRNRWAALGFTKLGSRRTNAIPDLIQILDRNISPHSQEATATALLIIGPAASNAVPSLMRVVSDTNNPAARSALEAIVKIRPGPQVYVPFLIDCLSDQRRDLRIVAAKALEDLGPAAKPAIPALSIAFNDPSPAIRLAAENALLRIDPDTAVLLAREHPGNSWVPPSISRIGLNLEYGRPNIYLPPNRTNPAITMDTLFTNSPYTGPINLPTNDSINWSTRSARGLQLKNETPALGRRSITSVAADMRRL